MEIVEVPVDAHDTVLSTSPLLAPSVSPVSKVIRLSRIVSCYFSLVRTCYDADSKRRSFSVKCHFVSIRVWSRRLDSQERRSMRNTYFRNGMDEKINGHNGNTQE